MAEKTPNAKTLKSVETLIHEEASRKNIPTAEFQSVMRREEESPVQVAYQRRNRDLDPQLVWRGKDEQDWSDLVVQAPPLYIQEKVHPKALMDSAATASVPMTISPVSGRTSTGFPTRMPAPSSTSTTQTGPTA